MQQQPAASIIAEHIFILPTNYIPPAKKDLPKAYSHFHYLSCFKIGEINQLNEELINSFTTPIFLNNHTAKNLIEIDTIDDVKRLKLKKKYKNK